MKFKYSCFISIVLLFFFNACTKDSEECSSCAEGLLEICDNGDGTITLKIEGEEEQRAELNDGVTFDDAVEQICSNIVLENCYECMGPNANDFDVCKEGEDIIVNGTVIPELRGFALEDVIDELVANVADDEVFRNLSCERK